MGHESLSESHGREERERRGYSSWSWGLSQPIREPVKNDQWQRDGFTMLTSVPWDTRGSAVESVSGDRRKHVTDSLIQDETPRGPAHLMASLRVTTKCQREAWTVDESKRDRWRPNSSKSCEGLTIGWC